MVSMSRGRSIGRISMVCWVVVLVAAVGGQVVGAASPGPEAYVHSRVLEAVRETGEARVIVVMGDPALPEARAWDWRRRGAANAELGRMVMRAAPRFQVGRQYRLFPFLAGSVDEQGLRELAACPTVEAVYPDRELRAVLDDSGPLIGQPTVETAGHDGDGVGIAILDTGVDYTHPDLGGSADEIEFPNTKVVGGYDFVNLDSRPMDDEGHGTYVGGIAAGTGGTYRGIAPGAHLIAVKVLDHEGTGSASGVIAGIEWCIEHRDDHDIKVINLSLSDAAEWSNPEECDADPQGQAIADAVDNGIVVVAAAGNGGYDGGVGIPACVTEAIGVGASYDATYGGSIPYGDPPGSLCTDTTPSVDDIACFSNRGELLDVLAPGAIIISAKLGGSYEQNAGTSAATPHVAGAAAVLFDIMGMSTSPAAIRDRLRRTGVQIVDPLTEVATPRIDLVRAMNETPTSGPDLVVTQVQADTASALVGDPVEVSVTVENQGDSASGACTALVVISANQIASPQDRVVVSVAVPALSVGESHASGWESGTVPAMMPGEYWIAAYVDSGYVVTEKDETNNGMSGAGMTVEGMSSYVMSSSIPASMLKGQTYAISVVMWNDGTAAWTAAGGFALKAVSPEGTARWGISTVGLPGGRTVNAGGAVTFTFNVTAPGEVGLHPCHWRMARGDVYFGEMATGATKTRLVDDATDGQDLAAVSGEWAAYQDHRAVHYGSVSVTNLATMWSMMLPDDIPFDIDPVTHKPTNAGYEEFLSSRHRFPDVSGSWAAWMVNDRSGGGGFWYYQVVAYNVLTPSLLPRRIVYANWDAIWPTIDGSLVVWEDYRNDPDRIIDPDYWLNDDSDIYIYDITTDTSYPLCTAAGPQFAPRISGDLVVWEDWRDITPDVQSDIYLYDLSVDTDGDGTPNWRDLDRPDPDPAEMMVTDTWWSEQWPDVSGRRVVWLDLRRDTGTGKTIDIYLRDLDGPTATAVATDPATERYQPRLDGTKVTWTDWRQANPDAYWMDVATGAGGPIGGSSAAEELSDVSGDRVIYEKHRATVGAPGDEWYVYNVWVQERLRDGSVGVHTFTDVPSDFWAWEYVEAAVENGVVQGFPDGTYQPSWIVSRDQMAVYVARALAGGDGNVPPGPGTGSFSDVPTDHWAYKYIEYCSDPAQDVVQGFPDETYGPELSVDRGTMAVYIGRAIAGGDSFFDTYVPPATASFPDVPTGFWSYAYIEYIKGEGVTGGYLDGLYHPEYLVGRDQMAVYVSRAFGYVD